MFARYDRVFADFKSRKPEFVRAPAAPEQSAGLLTTPRETESPSKS